MGSIEHSEEKTATKKTFWQKIKDFFAKLFREEN